jgi:hypothetical protein
MTASLLTFWLASGESAALEFKKSTAEKDRACRRWRPKPKPRRRQVGTKLALRNC